MTEHSLQLADGRTLAYVCYGSASAQPVLYFHGTPSSRLEPQVAGVWGTPVETLLNQYHLQLIAVDRPGMGLSTFQEQRTPDSFAADVKVLTQSLGIEKFPLICWSGGGPYALAMAYHYPQLISGVYIIAGFSASFGEPDVIDQMSWNSTLR